MKFSQKIFKIFKKFSEFFFLEKKFFWKFSFLSFHENFFVFLGVFRVSGQWGHHYPTNGLKTIYFVFFVVYIMDANPPALSKTYSSIIWELPKKTKLIYNHKHWSQTHQTLCFQVLQWLRVLEFTFLRNAPRPEFTLDWGLLFQCQTDSLRDRIERPLFDLGWNHQPDYHWAYSE